MPLEGQAKLLRILETGELTPLGSTAKTRVDFRLIAAVQEDVLARVEARQFRRDLLHRIEGIVIQLPPLRARLEDVEPLATYFAAEKGYALDHTAIALLRRLNWPGNVRQLRTVVERACILADGTTVGTRPLAEALEGGIDIRRVPDAADCERFMEVCRSHGNDVSRVAAALGISRATLYRRLKSYGVRLSPGSASTSLSLE
jgi:transcriptional regulator of acetoin/glycerol metabolism